MTELIRRAYRFTSKEIFAGALRKVGSDIIEDGAPAFAFFGQISDQIKYYVAHAWPDHAMNRIIDLILHHLR